MWSLGKIRELLIVSLIVISCKSGNWPDHEQKKFKEECKAEGGSKSYCSCFLENVMTKYPNVSDFDQMEFETAVELSKDCI